MKKAMNILLTIAGIYLVLLLVMYLSQSRMIFFPTAHVPYDPSVYNLSWEDVNIETDDGLVLHGWYIPNEESEKVLLLSHGNAGNISHRLGFLDSVHRTGLSAFIYDYRGYGKSEGRPDEEGVYRDVHAAYRYLTDRKKYSEDEIVLFGRSLGAAVSSHLAQNAEPAGLVIESGFTSVKDIASELYPFIPSFLLRSELATVDYLQNISVPVLIMHSSDDALIGFHHGEILYEAAREPKYFVELRGGHNDNYITSGNLYFGELKKFIDSL